MVADGHTLCNHTWDHDLSSCVPAATTRSARVHAADQRRHPRDRAGRQDQYFRNPGGNFGPNTVAVAASLGMKSLMWSVDPRDWTRPGTQAIIDRVIGHTGPARSCSPTTAVATGRRPWPPTASCSRTSRAG